MPIRQTGDRAEPVVRLFCFPYSGASATVFGTWSRTLPAFIQVHAVELPGRGRRMREAPLCSLNALVDDVASRIAPLAEGLFAFFGHSMGALLSYELARRLQAQNGSFPMHLFVSGHLPPDSERSTEPIHGLPEPEFLDQIRALQGTPEELLDHDDFRDLLLPILRADFEVCETYDFMPNEPLQCGITAFGGLDDSYVKRADLEFWRSHTTGPFSIRMFPGNHFFLNTARPTVLQAIAQELFRVLPGRG